MHGAPDHQCFHCTVKAIGIGAGGQIDADQGLVFSATDVLPGWKGQRITEAFERGLKLQTIVDNDVNVLGLGESRFRAARHLNNAIVVFLALGTGVGGAIIIDGKLVRGSHWSGGELGHILVSMDDVPLSWVRPVCSPISSCRRSHTDVATIPVTLAIFYFSLSISS